MKKSHYDGYDYPKYWKERDYEHKSEIFAINKFLIKLPKLKSIADIGCGFGRLLPSYYSKGEKITLIDPSSELLKKAKDKYKKYKNVTYTCKNIQQLSDIKPKSFDLIVMVRVLHHVEDLDEAFENINRILKPKGYLILEFANKMHGKDQIKNIIKGNFIYPMDLSPVDKRSNKNKKDNVIAFLNHHPETVFNQLKSHDFKVLESRSVSNFRFKLLKRLLGTKTLFWVEKKLQKPLFKLHFGPSIFILARKK